MGKILNNEWSIETYFEVEFDYNDTNFLITGKALVEYKSDETDNYIDVQTPDENEAMSVKIWMNNVLLQDNNIHNEIFNTLYDVLTETLESEISPDKTDITNEDFENLEIPDLDELLRTL